MTRRRLTDGEVRDLVVQLDLLQQAITRGEVTASAATTAMLSGARVGLLVASGVASTEVMLKLVDLAGGHAHVDEEGRGTGSQSAGS